MLYDGNPDLGARLLAEESWPADVPAYGGFVARAVWVPEDADRGSHRITAVVSLAGGSEEDLSNNRAEATFAVVDDELDILESYVFPNPANPAGGASLHYFLTQPAGVEVGVFDAKGRRVGGMTRPGGGGRVPGVNFMEVSVPLSEVVDDYSELPGGVYFYRIAAEGDGLRRELKGRFIVVR
jgi:hypothetical protein